jgi:hypothetical protein
MTLMKKRALFSIPTSDMCIIERATSGSKFDHEEIDGEVKEYLVVEHEEPGREWWIPIEVADSSTYERNWKRYLGVGRITVVMKIALSQQV